MKSFLFVFLLLLALSHPSFATETKVVVKKGEVAIGEDTTKAQARAMALNNARRAAIDEVSGAQVSGSTVVYNAQVISYLVTSASRGVIVKEEVYDEVFDGELYKLKIRAEVKIPEQRDEGKLRISKESVSRYGATAMENGAVFQDNDEIQVRARVNSLAFIHLFSIDKDGMVTKLYPNEYIDWEPVAISDQFIFPDDKLREMGLKLRVRAAKSLGRTPETMLIIASAKKINLLTDKKEGEVTITDLMKEVSEIVSPWTEKVIGYEVRK
jgi:exopolysaccharide biosynthesis protein